LQHRQENPVRLFDQRQEEMLDIHRLVLHLFGVFLGTLDDFLRLECELIEPHVSLLAPVENPVLLYTMRNIKPEPLSVKSSKEMTPDFSVPAKEAHLCTADNRAGKQRDRPCIRSKHTVQR
jgi:hypothetical protein